MVHAKGGVHWEMTRAGSGREIQSDVGADDDPRTRIAKLRSFVTRDWMIQRDRGAGMQDAVTNLEHAVLGLHHLRVEIRRVSEAVLPLEVYRASKAGRSHAPENSPEYFLPPPGTLSNSNRLPEGRFNDIGVRALYLATQADILPAEMTQRGFPGEFLVARFQVKLEGVKIANLLPAATKDLPHVNDLVGEAERRRTPDVKDSVSDPYPHTIFLRHELEVQGFQGAAYPSVHDNHKDDPDGYNLVVFDEELFERIILQGWTGEVNQEVFEPSAEGQPKARDQ